MLNKEIKFIWGKKNEKGKLDGLGITTYTNGERFIGIYKNGIRNGKGIYKYSDGTKYYGNWKNGKQSGFGKMLLTTNEYFECNWKNGKENGLVTYFYLDGSKSYSSWFLGQIIENHDSPREPWLHNLKNRFRKKRSKYKSNYDVDESSFFSKKSSKYVRKY